MIHSKKGGISFKNLKQLKIAKLANRARRIQCPVIRYADIFHYNVLMDFVLCRVIIDAYIVCRNVRRRIIW